MCQVASNVSGGIYPAKTRQQEQMLFLRIPKLMSGNCSDQIHSNPLYSLRRSHDFMELSRPPVYCYVHLLYTHALFFFKGSYY